MKQPENRNVVSRIVQSVFVEKKKEYYEYIKEMLKDQDNLSISVDSAQLRSRKFLNICIID